MHAWMSAGVSDDAAHYTLCLCTAYRVFQLGSVHVATSPPIVTVFISVLVHVLFLQEIGFEAEPHIEYQA